MSKRKKAREAQLAETGGTAQGTPRFRADMLVADVVDAHPKAQEVLSSFGLPCSRCIVAWHETLADGCGPLALDTNTVLERLNALPQ